MGRTHILGEPPLELGHSRTLANPAAAQHFEYSSLFFHPDRGAGYRNGLGGFQIHNASTATAGADFAARFHCISSRSPCSRATSLLNPSSVFAFSTAALRAWTFPTLRTSRCSGFSDEPVSLRIKPHNSFRLVCTPVPTLNTSSVTSLSNASRFARATSPT